MRFKRYKAVILVLFFSVLYSSMETRISSGEKYSEKNKVEVTAHRGSSLKARDNSIEAIKLAINEKADYIEVDARRTKDNKIVLSHDDIFFKDDGNTISIVKSTLSQLNKNSGSILFGKEDKVASLEKTLKLVKEKTKINIDLKVNEDDELLPKLVVNLIEKYNMEDDTVITSSNYNAIINVKKYNKSIKVGYITDALPKNIDINKIDILSIKYDGLNKDIVEKFHRYNKQVFVWTVNNEREVEKAIGLGVDNIITNDVTMVRNILNKISSNVGGHLSFYQLYS